MININKTLLSVALTASFAVASTNAMAVSFPLFTVDPSAYEPAQVATLNAIPGPIFNIAPFEATKITGAYTEVATFVDATNFATSILWEAGQFVDSSTNTTYGGNVTGLGSVYKLYALFTGTGTYTANAAGSIANFVFNTGNVSLYYDGGANTTFTQPGTGAVAWGTTNGGEDLLIGSGSILTGGGTLDTTTIVCAQTLNCGSFGTQTSFELDPATPGNKFFTLPNPFYNLTFEAGQFNKDLVVLPGSTQKINGSLDVTFGKSVPEPTTLALIGLGLMGFGLGRRKQA